MRIELFAHPDREIWREVDVRSDITLPVLHDIMQTVMGWTDAHLHRFSTGDHSFAREELSFLTPFDIAEGDEGVSEADVRLDEVVRDVGDVLCYLYDLGDGWEHTLTLIDIGPLAADADVPRCRAGRRACPPENSGGAPGYSALVAAVDDVQRSGDLARWATERHGWLLRGVALPESPAELDEFDVDAVNAALRARSIGR